MGKALLIIVLGAGLALAQQLYTAFLNEGATGKDQTEYQEETIAREIAASAFNLGMGVVRAHREDVQSGAIDLNGPGNAGRSGTYATGRFAGGRYEVRAELTSPHSIRVIATGYFGRSVNPTTGQEDWSASFTMHDDYLVPSILAPNTDGLINVRFLESQAGYCSAVFYQAYTPDMPEGFVPEPVMLFAADNRDRKTARPAQQIKVVAGTRMNFLIGVDQNCSLRLTTVDECEIRSYAQNYTYKVTDFDYVHSALVVEAGSLDDAREDIWSIVEQHPTNRQRWRIGWEDIHNTDWDNPASNDPATSLQALKRLGYFGTGWPDQDANLYRLLRDYGSRPDFSDQVIEVSVVAATSSSFVTEQNKEEDEKKKCGETEGEVIGQEKPTTGGSTSGGSTSGGSTSGGSTDGGGSTGGGGSTDGGSTDGGSSDGGSSTADDSSDPLTQFACGCTKNNTNNKTPILHRPPGNESNEQLLCLPPPAVDTHRKQHNDVFPTCRARQEIKNKNKK